MNRDEPVVSYEATTEISQQDQEMPEQGIDEVIGEPVPADLTKAVDELIATHQPIHFICYD